MRTRWGRPSSWVLSMVIFLCADDHSGSRSTAATAFITVSGSALIANSSTPETAMNVLHLALRQRFAINAVAQLDLSVLGLATRSDRMTVVWGKSVSEGVDPGGSSNI